MASTRLRKLETREPKVKVEKPPKKPRKPYTKKNKAVKEEEKDTIIQAEDLEKELAEFRSSNTLFSHELRFIQANGFTPDILKKFYAIQTDHSESTFTPSKLFDPVLDKAVENNINGLFSVNNYKDIRKPKLKKLRQFKKYFENFNLTNQVEFQFNDHQSEVLNSNNIINFPFDEKNLRNGFVFNTGGLALTMEWCPIQINDSKFLFMTVVDKNSNISEFSTKKSLLTIVEVGRYAHSNELDFKINRKIMIDSIIKEIEFSYISSDTETLLKLTLSSGEIEVWRITPEFFANKDSVENVNIYSVDSGILKFKIPHKEMLITSSRFATSNHIIIGTNHGYIGQYSIDTGKLDYLIHAKIPAITNVQVSIPSDANDDCIHAHISATDFNNYLVRLPISNKRSPLLGNLRIIECPVISRELLSNRNVFYLTYNKAFITVENNVLIRYTSIENPTNSRKFRVGAEDDICCLSGQTNYDNGHLNTGFMLITGHVNGTLRLYNYLNLLTMGEKRNSCSTLKLLQLNKTRENDNKFWLDMNIQSDKMGESKSTSGSSMKPVGRYKDVKLVTPASICPLKISMLGTTLASSWGNGLVIIEDLIT